MSYLLAALPGNLHWLFSPQQIHLNQCGTAQPEKCEKMYKAHTVQPGAVTLVRQEEPQLPLHAKQMRSGLKTSLRTAPSLISLWNNPLPTPIITLLWANMSSLHCNFSYADVPSNVFLLVVYKAVYCFVSVLLLFFLFFFSSRSHWDFS